MTVTSCNDDRSWRSLEGPLHAERLATSRVGGPTLILLHGFTQTRCSWRPFIDALEEIESPLPDLIRVDLPGHGGSQGVVADLPTTADLVVETCGSGIYCGYSMGARVALHIALQHPTSVEAVISIGGTPGIIDPDERRQRRRADEVLADTIERIGTRAFIEQWLSQPMFENLPRTQEDLEQRRANSATGLASSLRLTGTGTQVPLWSDLVGLDIPVLLLAGSLDEKFSEIADRMATTIGSRARSVRISDAGHSAHIEKPRGVARVVTEFLSSDTRK